MFVINHTNIFELGCIYVRRLVNRLRLGLRRISVRVILVTLMLTMLLLVMHCVINSLSQITKIQQIDNENSLLPHNWTEIANYQYGRLSTT